VTIDGELVAPVSASAPEIDPASAASGLTLLAGALLVLRGRRRTVPVATFA
jgi:LPXTG-motif cell wall-anchored protein